LKSLLVLGQKFTQTLSLSVVLVSHFGNELKKLFVPSNRNDKIASEKQTKQNAANTNEYAFEFMAVSHLKYFLVELV
jgi:hypothetical protein